MVRKVPVLEIIFNTVHFLHHPVKAILVQYVKFKFNLFCCKTVYN